MAKSNLTVTLDDYVRASLIAEADDEGRSISNMLERVLRERYGSVLAEPGRPSTGGPEGTQASVDALPAAALEALPGSASADSNDAAGTNGKRTAAKGEGKQRTTRAGKQVAILGTATAGNPAPSPKTKCKDPSHGRVGWKCRGCGEMF